MGGRPRSELFRQPQRSRAIDARWQSERHPSCSALAPPLPGTSFNVSKSRKAVLGGMGVDFTNPDWPRRVQFYEALTYDTVASLHSMVQYVQQSGLDQRALALLQKYQPSTPVEILSGLKNHILVIHGDSDVDNGSADQLAAIFPHGELAVTPGDHNHAAATPEFAIAVIQFFKKPDE